MHTVTTSPEGPLHCTCKGFRYSVADPPTCVHCREVLGEDVEGAKLTPVLRAVSGVGKNIDATAISPMLASIPKDDRSVDDYPASEWVLEEKFDGHRLIVQVNHFGSPKAWSRVGNPRPLEPHIIDALKSIPPGTYDGELYVPGGTSTDVKALDKAKHLALVFFDLLKVDEFDAMAKSGRERRELLLIAMSKVDDRSPIHASEQWAPSEERLRLLWVRGGEGGILKRIDAPYSVGKRSRDWIKLKKGGKCRTIVLGFEAGLSGPHSVIRCQDANGVITTVKTLNNIWLHWFDADADSFIGRTLVISYTDRTRDGNFHHPMADHFEETAE